MARRLTMQTLGPWRSIMLAVVGMLLLLWLVQAISIYAFVRVQRDFADLSASQVPRVVLASELGERSARLAGLATEILGTGPVRPDVLSDAEALAAGLRQALSDPLLTSTGLADAPGAGDRVLLSIRNLVARLERKRSLESALARQLEALRWLNVDIQDEIDPLLNDYEFNIQTAMQSLAESDDPAQRTAIIERVAEERRRRDLAAGLGGDASTSVTLLVQAAVATDPEQLGQLTSLVEDSLSRIKEEITRLPPGPEFLTLRQSLAALDRAGRAPDGPLMLRRDWFDLQSAVYADMQATQTGVADLQEILSAVTQAETETVLASIEASTERLRWMTIGLIVLALVVGIAGYLAVFRIVRSGIVVPLRALTDRMVRIAEGQHPADAGGHGNEITRIGLAVDEFNAALQSRDRAIADLQHAQDDLVQAGKMAALGQLSAGISHELNQPLAALGYRLTMLEQASRTGDLKAVDRQIERVTGLVERMNGVLSHLRRFASRSRHEKRPVPLADTIESLRVLFRGRLAHSGITLTVADGVSDRTVLADPILFEQVLVNLLSNSIDAIEEAGVDGQITIGGTAEGGTLHLTVSDNGVGLGEMSSEQAMDPFVTSKEVGSGMGLGLSISYNIARDMGGDLFLTPGETQGAVAHFLIPEEARNG